MTDTHNLSVRLPARHGLSQDQEYCIVIQDGSERKIRFHDYHEIYRIPGLYEHLFSEKLKCTSPNVVTSLLMEKVQKSPDSMSDLVVLDLGAGNGMVGEVLVEKGVGAVVGVDIIEEAAEAVRRDRPDIYDRYYVQDLCRFPEDTRREFEATGFNCLVCVAALGFGDIPPAAFANAYNVLVEGAWVAFNIKEDFINGADTTGFSAMIRRSIDEGALEVVVEHTYPHRLAVDGTPLDYVAVVGKKRADIPAALI